MGISVLGVFQLPFHRANVPIGRPFLGIEEWKTLVNPLLSVSGIGVPFGVVIEAELEAAARADHVSGAAMFVARRLRQTVISANGTDISFLVVHWEGGL